MMKDNSESKWELYKSSSLSVMELKEDYEDKTFMIFRQHDKDTITIRLNSIYDITQIEKPESFRIFHNKGRVKIFETKIDNDQKKQEFIKYMLENSDTLTNDDLINFFESFNY